VMLGNLKWASRLRKESEIQDDKRWRARTELKRWRDPRFQNKWSG
jgi:hypothetical protein